MMTVAKAELLRLTQPVIERLCRTLDGTHTGVAVYALLAVTVSLRHKTGITLGQIHELVDQLGETSQELNN